MTPRWITLITGASRGIGRAIAEHLLHDAHQHVVGFARSPSTLDHPRYRHICGDLLSPTPDADPLEHAATLITEALAQGVDRVAVVHNLGRVHKAPLTEIDPADWAAILHANLTVPFLWTRRLSPLMPRASVHLYLGSTLSEIAVHDTAAYVAAKHGLLGLMRSAALDLAQAGIRANLVCPGFTETEMADEVLAYGAARAGQDPATHRAHLQAAFPLGRMVQPAEIARLVAYLIGADSANGSVVHVDGGYGLLP